MPVGLAVAPIDAFDLLLTLEVPVRIGGWYTGAVAVELRVLGMCPSVTGANPGELTRTNSGVLPESERARTPIPGCGETASGVPSGSEMAVAVAGPAEGGGIVPRRVEWGRGGRFCWGTHAPERLKDGIGALPKWSMLPMTLGTDPWRRVDVAWDTADTASLPEIR